MVYTTFFFGASCFHYEISHGAPSASSPKKTSTGVHAMPPTCNFLRTAAVSLSPDWCCALNLASLSGRGRFLMLRAVSASADCPALSLCNCISRKQKYTMCEPHKFDKMPLCSSSGSEEADKESCADCQFISKTAAWPCHHNKLGVMNSLAKSESLAR